MKVTFRLLSPISFHNVWLGVTRGYHCYIRCLHDYYALFYTSCCVLLCPRHSYRIFLSHAVVVFQVGKNAVICVDELPCLPKGAACGVLVDARAFLVALATFLESLNLLCAWQRLSVLQLCNAVLLSCDQLTFEIVQTLLKLLIVVQFNQQQTCQATYHCNKLAPLFLHKFRFSRSIF